MKKTIYITGGSKGIGYGIAEVLLKNNFAVAISGRDQSDIDIAVENLNKISTDVFGVTSNVRNFEDEKNAVSKIIDKFGKIDGVIANAGLGFFKPVDQMEIEEWNAMIETNLTGVFHSLKASVEELKKSEGYFISISSLAGTNFFENGSGYNASKFGVVGFTQAAMVDLRKYGIKISTIMPGSVSSHFNGHTPNEEDAWKIQPEDIGNLVLDLLKMNPRTLPSKIEVRPTRPDLK
ncbi:SDR family oxidoreductase [Frigoriflavimonas asaccharolytica]|uniref:NADP-dependent 3-hydroxy acid dehydrogenase YdfG n=1 Tax=Frigoriflavimonas asaccharolytica TaxID=2735899 RepID=A0A8J8GAA7_9FLAO|nr:SDR family oxidoreductase [Frigoriflavimonas asaccharolytica]NRS91927.1 NADP-dependent 3-hydroxy acid dehydrogenase YdfG [Frigoriflavimonas asaccharolytica]